MLNYSMCLFSGAAVGMNAWAIVACHGGAFNYIVGGLCAATCLIFGIKAARQ